MNYTFLIAMCDLAAWQLLLGLLLPFILGYLLRRFIDSDKKDKLLKLESDYNLLQSEVSKNASFKTSFLSAESDNKKLQSSINTYEKEVARLKAEINETQKKTKAFAGIDLSALQSKIASLEINNTNLQNTLAAIQNKGNENDGTEQTVSIEELQANADAMKERFRYIESENARLKIDLKSAIAAKDSIVRSEENLVKYKEEVREMSGKIGGFTVESERLKKETADAIAKAKASTEELNELKSKMSGEKSNSEIATAQTNELQSKINALQNELNTANVNASAANQLATELKEAKSKLAETEINLSSAKLKIEQAANALPVTVEKIVEIEKIVEVQVDKIVEKIVNVEIEKIVEKTMEVSLAADKKQIADLEAQIVALKSNTAPIAVKENVPLTATVINTKEDDLETIEGIGPKVNDLFKAKGVITYAQLAALSKEEVAAVLESGGSHFQILNGNSWPKQASLLRDGNMTEFKKYTDYLIAGVDPSEVKDKLAASDKTKKDDLKIVEGIGPKIEGLLNAEGIYTFAELAASNTERLKGILDNAGSRYQIHDPSTWPTQAALARDGKTEELQKMQDELKGGKK